MSVCFVLINIMRDRVSTAAGMILPPRSAPVDR